MIDNGHRGDWQTTPLQTWYNERILTYYAERLDEYLGRFHRRPEGLATVGLIGNATAELSATGQTTVKGAMVMIN